MPVHHTHEKLVFNLFRKMNMEEVFFGDQYG